MAHTSVIIATAMLISILGVVSGTNVTRQRIELPLWGGSNDYITRINIGNEEYIVTIDTTTSDLLVAGLNCASQPQSTCSHLSQLYNYKDSNATIEPYSLNNCFSSIELDNKKYCGALRTYTDGTKRTGVYVTDEVRISGLNMHSSFIAYTEETKGSWNLVRDGSWGLGQTKAEKKRPSLTDPLSSLFEVGLKKSFSICTGTTGGVFVVGEPSQELYTGDFITIPMEKDIVSYNLQVSSFGFGDAGSLLSGSVYTGIVDTSRTIYVPSGVYKALKHYFFGLCTGLIPGLCDYTGKPIKDDKNIFHSDFCMEVGDKELLLFYPKINVTLQYGDNQSHTFNLPPTAYFEHKIGSNNKPCRRFAIESLANTGLSGDTILFGKLFLDNYYVVFDIESNSISLAKPTIACSSTPPPTPEPQIAPQTTSVPSIASLAPSTESPSEPTAPLGSSNSTQAPHSNFKEYRAFGIAGVAGLATLVIIAGTLFLLYRTNAAFRSWLRGGSQIEEHRYTELETDAHTDEEIDLDW